jgi:menaquinone-dependent protoporphyrinogen oxidase
MIAARWEVDAMARALVVYASRHGATAGIAERIGEVMRSTGIEVMVADAADDPDPGGFDAFVIGSAAYIGKWEKDATDYVKRHQAAIAAKPCWLFSSGPVGTERVDKKGNSVLADPRTVVELRPILQPRGTEVFFGAWDPSSPSASLAERIVRQIPAIKELLPTGDFREWPVIEAWAREVAQGIAEPVPVA